MTHWLPSRISDRVYLLLLLILAPAPFIFEWVNQPFYLDLLSRALILAIAVISLNLILGFGGMISLGHAAYLGIGAYCVGIPFIMTITMAGCIWRWRYRLVRVLRS